MSVARKREGGLGDGLLSCRPWQKSESEPLTTYLGGMTSCQNIMLGKYDELVPARLCARFIGHAADSRAHCIIGYSGSPLFCVAFIVKTVTVL